MNWLRLIQPITSSGEKEMIFPVANSFKSRIPRLIILLLCTTAPVAQATLNISASTPINPARPGELLPIEFVVTNTDGVARSGVVIEMTYPDNLVQLSEAEFDGNCPSTTCSTGELVTWTLGNLPAGGAISVELPVFVTINTVNGAIISFVPTVSDDATDDDSGSLDVEVQTNAIYDVSIIEDRDPAAAGSEITYKLTYGYRADAAAVNLSTLRFPVPANTTFVSATGGGAQGGGSVDWALGNLGPGDGGVREVTVTLDGGLSDGDVVAASGEVFANATPGENAESQANTVITTAGGLNLLIESNTNPARASELVNVDLTVTNTDAFTRFGVTISARTPQDLEAIFESEFDGNCSSTTCTAGELISWTLGDIAAGQSATVNLPVFVWNIAIGGVLLNLPATASDSTGVQSRQTDTLRVQTDSIYDLSLAEQSDPATAGSNLTYRLIFGYRDDAAALNNSILRLPLPAGTTFVSATDGGTAVGGAVEWALGSLSPGDSGIRETTLLLDGGLAPADVIEAVAEVSSVTDPGEVARAEANTVIAAASGLQLAIQSNANASRLSEHLNIELTVTNHDAFPRFGVNIIGRYPQDLLPLQETGFEGNCNSTTCIAGERLTFTLGEIGGGETITATMPPSISNVGTSGELINFYMRAEDDQGVQTRQMESVRIQTDTIYDLAIAENSDPAAAGEEMSYKLSYGYRADAGAVNQSILRLPLPGGTTFVSASGGGVLNSGAVEWALGFLSPGNGGVRTATLQADGGLTSGTVIEAAAEISSLSSPFERARAEANTVIAASDPLGLAFEIVPGPVRPSELINHQITVTNNDPFTRFGVVLTQQYPQDLNPVFETAFEGNCPSTNCSPGEKVTWLLGDIPAGDSKTVQMPPSVTPNATEGVLINFFVNARDDQGAQTRQMDTVRVQSDATYDLAITENVDPATAGSMLSYELTFGYLEDAAAVSDSTLRLHIPAGAAFVSATGGGFENNGHVDWNLGFLSPGDGGVREATFLIDGGLAPASVLEAVANVSSVSSPDEGASAQANTVIRDSVSLALDVDALVFAGVAGRRLNMRLTVTNHDPFTRFGVALRSRFPQNVNQLFESDPGFDGDCPGSSCNPGDTVVWPLVDIPAGQSVSLTFAPTVATPAIDGRMINFFAWVEDDQGVQARDSQPVYTGCIDDLDGDCDGVHNSIDNCTLVPNISQCDGDGDNYGNHCDADFNNDLITNGLDIGPLKAAFGTADAETDLNCDGIVNGLDIGPLKAMFGTAPGPSGLVP